jgi:hypothetical protein
MIVKPIKVKALDNYSIFVWFSDGVQGSVNLNQLAGAEKEASKTYAWFG